MMKKDWHLIKYVLAVDLSLDVMISPKKKRPSKSGV